MSERDVKAQIEIGVSLFSSLIQHSKEEAKYKQGKPNMLNR